MMIKRTIAALALAAGIFTGTQVGVAAHAGGDIIRTEQGTRPVAHLRVTYSEQITPSMVYIEFNTGAAQFMPKCKDSRVTDCAEVKSGRVRLEDGSRLKFARWVR